MQGGRACGPCPHGMGHVLRLERGTYMPCMHGKSLPVFVVGVVYTGVALVEWLTGVRRTRRAGGGHSHRMQS